MPNLLYEHCTVCTALYYAVNGPHVRVRISGEANTNVVADQRDGARFRGCIQSNNNIVNTKIQPRNSTQSCQSVE